MTKTYQVVWERRDLLEPRDRDVRDALVLALLQQRGVHLAGAEDVAPDALRLDEPLGVRVGEVPQEVRVVGHLGELGPREGVAQEGFGEEADELRREVSEWSG